MCAHRLSFPFRICSGTLTRLEKLKFLSDDSFVPLADSFQGLTDNPIGLTVIRLLRT